MNRCSLILVWLVSLHSAVCLSISVQRYPSQLHSSRLHLDRHHAHRHSAEVTISFLNDDNKTTMDHIDLLLRPSQAINSHLWKKKASTYCHNITTFKAAHELVTDRKTHALGFEEPNHECLLHPVGDFVDFSTVTSVPYMKLDDGSLSFTMFNNTGTHYVVSTLRDGEWTPSVHETAALKDCLYCPSATFLQDSNITLLNRGHYDPTMYQRNDDAWDMVTTVPFFRAGGENLGSLFTRKQRLYASLRFNVPYNPDSIGGHGYRSIGTYSVLYDGTASSNVVSWLAPDSCLDTCYDNWRNASYVNNHLSLDAQKFRSCIVPEGDTFKRSLAVDDGRCLRLALGNNTTNDEGSHDSFVSFIACAHECRDRNQLYQPAISIHGDHMLGVVARFTGMKNCSADACRNEFHVCQVLDGFEWDEHCFDDDSVFLEDSTGEHGHAVSSELVLHDEAYFIATAPKARTNCSAHVYHWPRRAFSYITTQAATLQGSVALRIYTPPSGSVFLFCQSTHASRTCVDEVEVTANEDGDGLCLVTVVSSTLADNAGMEKLQCELECSPGSTAVTLTVAFMKWHRLYGFATV